MKGQKNLFLLAERDHWSLSVFSTHLGGGIRYHLRTGSCIKPTVIDSRFLLTGYMVWKTGSQGISPQLAQVSNKSKSSAKSRTNSLWNISSLVLSPPFSFSLVSLSPSLCVCMFYVCVYTCIFPFSYIMVHIWSQRKTYNSCLLLPCGFWDSNSTLSFLELDF